MQRQTDRQIYIYIYIYIYMCVCVCVCVMHVKFTYKFVLGRNVETL